MAPDVTERCGQGKDDGIRECRWYAFKIHIDGQLRAR